MPEWLSNAVFYQIYPQSFKDSNEDGIGDINGIIEKLDYINSLGCNALWINPCFESPFKDGGYDVKDYKKVDPRYGSNTDLYRLFGEAHNRGIHVLLDLVPGHTSEEHFGLRRAEKRRKINILTDTYGRIPVFMDQTICRLWRESHRGMDAISLIFLSASLHSITDFFTQQKNGSFRWIIRTVLLPGKQ